VRVLGGVGVILALVAALASACGGASDAASGGSGGGGKLTLVAYSTPQEAYEEIIPAFQKSAAGQGVEFEQSYGASGEQSRAVEAGLPADVVEFALESDVTRLVDAGLVDSDWNQNEYKGILTDSVVALVVRKGNPKDIHTWDDLIKPGVEVITPNPFTSGGARWNIMAAYGAQIKQGKSEEEAVAYLNELFQHVAVQDESARDALQTFAGGKGDVLISYENEAITAQQKGEDVEYVLPEQTILIENPVAVTANSKHPKEAKAFLDFLRSEQAQQIFVDNGYRPVVDSVAAGKFPAPSGLFTIVDLGGWKDATKEFFDPEDSVMADVERGLGVSVEKK
jgi:sulfate/thiosulfate transport system substrate-binding protein